MVEYTTKRFITFLSASIVVAVLAVSLAPFGFNYLLPTTRAYILLSTEDALGKPLPTPWGKLNHTLVVRGNIIESSLQVTAVMEPEPSPDNVTVEIWFSPDFLAPSVVGGNLRLSSEMHQGDSITLRTSLTVESDGKYFIGGSGVSYLPGGAMGFTTRYYVDVQFGLVVRVSDTFEGPKDVELRCLSNC